MSGHQEEGREAVAAVQTLWNEKDCGIVYRLYRHTARIHQGAGSLIYGRENLLAWIGEVHAALSDLHLEVEESLADLDDSGRQRIWITWTLTGTLGRYSSILAPIGKSLNLAGLSLLRMDGGQIVEQWDSFNTADLLIQLGLHKADIFQKFSQQRPLFDPVQAGETERVVGQDAPEEVIEGSSGSQLAGYLLNQLWNFRNGASIGKTHDTDALLYIPGSAEPVTRQDYRNFVFSLIRIFPDLRCYVDEVSKADVSRAEDVVYVRWTLQGSHRKGGRYGEPTGRQVTVPVISRYRLGKNSIAEERLVFDELKIELCLYPYRIDRKDQEIREQDELL